MIQTMRTSIRHIRLWGVVISGILMMTGCSSDTVKGDPYYLTGNMITMVTESGNMYYLKTGNGTVSLTYNQSNPMHMSLDNKSAITDYVGEVTIPASITTGVDTYAVTGITANAFQNNTLLTKVNIPESVTSIGEMAFYNCPALTETNIPEGVPTLPDYCFTGCKALTTLTLPNHMNSISKTAIKGCSQLTALHIPEGITELPDSCLYGISKMTELTLPEGLTAIGEDCLHGCSGLTQLTLPKSLTTIKRLAFASCSKLTDIAIPEGVTMLPDSVFNGCTGLLTVYLPETMTTLAPSAFAGCRSMIEITLPVALTDIGEKCFYSNDDKTGESNWKNFTLYVKWETPPVLSGSITNAYQRRRLVVPKGCREAYLAADYWNEFTQIMEKNYQ